MTAGKNNWRLHFAAFSKKAVCISLMVLISLLSSSHAAWCWWWSEKSDQEIIRDALGSDNPKKVARCLDRLIKKQNYAGILQIKYHANKMLRQEKNRLVQSRNFDSRENKKHLAPWIEIEKKANQFFKRNSVKQEGKEPTVP